MPDLGKYAFEVGLAYGLSFVLLAALIAYLGIRSRKMRKTLKQIEDRRAGTKKDG